LLQLNDWMTTPLVTVPQDTHLDVCARLMARDGIRHLPVVSTGGRLRGMVYDVSLFTLSVMSVPEDTMPTPPTPEEARLPAFFVAVPPDIIAGVSAPLLSVIRRLADSRDDAVVAIDREQRPVGIFTEHDVVTRAAEHLRPGITTEWTRERRLITVQSEQPLSTALAKMKAARVRHLLVYEGEVFVGVLSYRDLAFGNIPSEDPARPGRAVGELVRVAPITAPVGTSLRDVARVMQEQIIGCVPILADGRVVRVITRSDISRALAVSLEDEVFFDSADLLRLSPMLD